MTPLADTTGLRRGILNALVPSLLLWGGIVEMVRALF